MNLKKILNSFRYAFQGIADLLRTQPSSHVHVLASVVVIALGIFFKIDRTEWMIVVLCIMVVISLEAMNTGLEYLTNLVSPDYHPIAGRAKDAAAAAVLLAAIGAGAIGLIIFVPKILDFWYDLHQ